ncbi:MAG: peptidoglycan DD-metalloendopeptidase family protein [Verrucomicrobiales bacterium]|nr:peptidoglycan DD-metalloendopeptidase family protein [Verrucomicrobiales bacterium]
MFKSVIFFALLFGAPFSMANESSDELIDWEGPIAETFELPVGEGKGTGYYVMRGAFDKLPGESWNGNGGGDTDLGNPVASIGKGVVIFAEDSKSTWGNMVIIRHAYRDADNKLVLIDSIYAHLFEIFTRKGEEVLLGEKIGAIGKSGKGERSAMLYFAIKKDVFNPVDESDPESWRDHYHAPRAFIEGFTQTSPDR